MENLYFFNKEEKILRNKIEIITFICYIIGLILFVITKCPITILTVVFAIPISLKLFKKEKQEENNSGYK